MLVSGRVILWSGATVDGNQKSGEKTPPGMVLKSIVNNGIFTISTAAPHVGPCLDSYPKPQVRQAVVDAIVDGGHSAAPSCCCCFGNQKNLARLVLLRWFSINILVFRTIWGRLPSWLSFCLMGFSSPNLFWNLLFYFLWSLPCGKTCHCSKGRFRRQFSSQLLPNFGGGWRVWQSLTHSIHGYIYLHIDNKNEPFM